MTRHGLSAPKRGTSDELTPERLRALPTTYVHPGQVCVSDAVGALVTILGSCVAVCLHDAIARVGGLNHFLLPVTPAHATKETAPRYAPTAIAALIDQMESRGGSRKRFTARIIGGASVLAPFGDQKDHLGHRNVAAARQSLAAHGIVVTGTDIGGTRGRKLVFVPREGAVVVQLIGAGVRT
ncbi:MAG TPA: chemotaxis protein CheD [Gemmatimonadaceae bacterium]|nr:chemotaxis protein CheD [Gemmatimonadaceae bacterium]